jgi:predicted SprT family Zn-dependent metalloprotease
MPDSRDANHRKLIAEFWELNHLHFGGVLPVIDLRFSGRLRTTGGQFFRKPARLIQISTRYLELPNAWEEIRDTLGHELVHYWLDFRGLPCGHTAEFRRKLRECGFNRYSRLRPVNAKHLYMCPGCGLRYHRRRRGVWSCGPCSGPRFDARFRLVLVHQPAAGAFVTSSLG